MAKVKKQAAFGLSLPELILRAVTESASIRYLHEDGRVLWSADALDRLSVTLAKHYKNMARDPIMRNAVTAMLEDGLDKNVAIDKIISALIQFILEVGTGLTIR